MTILCGHERETLIWACRFVDSPEIGHCRKWAHGEYVACEAVQTPTKLAELIAAELRRRGVDAGQFDAFGGHTWQIWGRRDGMCIDQPSDDSRLAVLTFQQARALLLRLLRLPEGASTDDVLKAVEMP